MMIPTAVNNNKVAEKYLGLSKYPSKTACCML